VVRIRIGFRQIDSVRESARDWKLLSLSLTLSGNHAGTGMADLKRESEPSMEEILASIRRIIAEDETPLPPPPASVAPDRPMPRPAPSSAPPSPAPASRPELRPEPLPERPAAAASQQSPTREAILDLTDRIDDESVPKRPPLGASQGTASGRLNRPPPLKTGGTPGGDPNAGAKQRIVSDSTVAASVATLSHIASLSTHAGRQQELPLGDSGRTLEEMVRELLRPHLKEWLDAHLPRLVERLVRDEINRLVREVQER
jgi:uncharacterized protein